VYQRAKDGRGKEKRGPWTLLALLEPFKGLNGLEGWVESSFVKPLEKITTKEIKDDQFA
jgi:hypothetical protein